MKVFLAANQIIRPNQKLGSCSGSHSVKNKFQIKFDSKINLYL